MSATVETQGVEVREEKESVARFLADLVDRERGDEQANVMTVLMGVVTEMDEGIEPIAGRLADTLRGYLDEQPLRSEHLPGALRVAVAAERSDPRPLTRRLFDMPELLSDHQRIVEAAFLLGRLADPFAGEVRDAAIRAFSEDPEVLLRPLNGLPPATAASLLNPDAQNDVAITIRELVDQNLDEGEKLASELIHAASERDDANKAIDLRSGVLWALLNVERAPIYDLARENADELEGGLSVGQERNSIALKALAQAPPPDWAFWAGQLTSARTFPAQADWAAGALVHTFESFADAEKKIQDVAPGIVEKLIGFVGADTDTEPVATALGGALAAREWWSDSSAREAQERLHRTGRALFGANEQLATQVQEHLLGDLRRAASLPLGTPVDEAAEGLVNMASGMPVDTQRDLASDFGEAMAGGGLDHELTGLLVSLRLAKSIGVGDGEEEAGPFLFTDDELLQAVDANSKLGNSVLRRWFAIGPAPQRVLLIAERLGGRSTRSLREAMARWAGDLSPDERSGLASQLIRAPQDNSPWIWALAQHALNEEAIISGVAAEVVEETQGGRRTQLVKEVAVVQPETPRGQRAIAKLMIQLLRTGRKNDFDAALAAAKALGRDHRSAEPLRKALKEASDEHGYKIPKGAAKHLAEAGIKPPKRSFKDGVFDTFKSLIR